MEKWFYVMMIKKGKSYNKVTKAVITRHVENLKKFVVHAKVILVLQVWSFLKHKAMKKRKRCADRSRLSLKAMRRIRLRLCRQQTKAITIYFNKEIRKKPEIFTETRWK